MENLNQIVASILEKGFLMSLATVDKNGVWVCDVIYVHDSKFNIYWISNINTRYSNAILGSPKIAATITISNNSVEINLGLQIEGNAQQFKKDIPDLIVQHRLKRGKSATGESREILDDDESWYMIKPTKIEIIDEKLWGFSKKIIRLDSD